ncbi:GDSL-type esterase/lipase family protein [Companilactobacillus metriopterae]|uniref:DUF459 domain-containing protein n=1 Tax=Companilactobacillus metriopterae TaxID=1909267 RepID=UPI00100B8133|nr:GDSL-type esterase/lipase family protein [Companilactobacillus metriopterae]
MKKKTIFIISAIVIVLIGCGIGGYFYYQQQNQETQQITKSKNKTTKKSEKVTKKTSVSIVAVGDSLTQGVGDTSKNGEGYVTRLSKKISKKYKVKTSTHNYGVSGDTSTQIMKRIDNNDKMHSDLKNADIITVTVGGNDFMHLLQKKGLDLTSKDISTEEGNFDKRLVKLLDDLRIYNKNAPIYLIGIYNPFSIYLSNVTGATSAFKKWNESSENVTKDMSNVHFVDINNLYASKYAINVTKKTGSNPYLFDEDHFHPNSIGYDMMTNKIFKEAKKTDKEWIDK